MGLVDSLQDLTDEIDGLADRSTDLALDHYTRKRDLRDDVMNFIHLMRRLKLRADQACVEVRRKEFEMQRLHQEIWKLHDEKKQVKVTLKALMDNIPVDDLRALVVSDLQEITRLREEVDALKARNAALKYK